MVYRVMYFAWLRERIGLPSEEVQAKVSTVADLVAHLKSREDRYALAFADTSAVKVAVNQELVDFDAKLQGGEEVAFFPPMTGG